MTIQEAIKSCRQFRKTDSSVWQGPILGDLGSYAFGPEQWVSDLFAEYEIEPKPQEKIEITRSQFIAALQHCGVTSSADVQFRLCKELGFKIE